MDVYRDDDDPTTETPIYLGAALANVNGNWSFIVTVDNGIGDPVMGTHSFSVSAEVDYPIYLPLVLRNY